MPDVKPRQRMPRSSGAACRQHAPHPTTSPGSCRSAGQSRSETTYHSNGETRAMSRLKVGEQLRPLEPDVRADERHADDLDEHVDDDDECQVERVAPAGPG